jgi:EAL domain-containing protein (putative c-di-GMP-specific phosphodiesterase class I)
MEPIGRWVLEAACAQAHEWLAHDGPRPLPVAVSVSASQLRDPRLADQVLRILLDKDLPAEYLELRLTERVLIDRSPIVEHALRRLQECGVRLSLDDFGKKHASLESLRGYSLSKLKVDPSFVRDLGTSARSAAITSAVIRLAAELDLTVIAETVDLGRPLMQLVDEGRECLESLAFTEPAAAAERMEKRFVAGPGRIQPS